MNIRLYAEIAAALILAVLFLFYRHSLLLDGQQQISSQDARAAALQTLAIEKQKAEDAQLLKDSQNAKDAEVARDHAAAALPAPALVCHAASPRAVPAPAGVSGSASTAAQALPGKAAVDFDPTDQLRALALEADLLAASCRELNADTHPEVPRE